MSNTRKTSSVPDLHGVCPDLDPENFPRGNRFLVRFLEEAVQEEAILCRQEILLRMLRKKFGRVPAKVKEKILATGNVTVLDGWLTCFAVAETLADVCIPTDDIPG